ncbi:MAG: CidA/LrgA family protein [Clostridiales bacterium]|nr:CidA/LrgA family protein [Candidatus Blautia equi]
MKYIRQFLLILFISFLGEILHYLIPMPIPASIYGIIILFLGLEFHIIPLDSVKETGKFLIEIMPVMFIPAGVGLMESWGLIKASWLQYIITIVVSTVLVMAVAGRVTQMIVRRKEKQS